jgi:hypothetical protein
VLLSRFKGPFESIRTIMHTVNCDEQYEYAGCLGLCTTAKPLLEDRYFLFVLERSGAFLPAAI